jgi:hypothetical protein
VVLLLVFLPACESRPCCSRGTRITLHIGDREVLVIYFSQSQNKKQREAWGTGMNNQMTMLCIF